MAQGFAAGLDALDAISASGRESLLAGSHLPQSVRVDLLMKLGNFPEALGDIQHPIALTEKLRERELSKERHKQMDKAPQST